MTPADVAWKAYLQDVPLGVIVGADGWRYQITWADVMWAVRATRGESEGSLHDAQFVVWTMSNRHYLLRHLIMGRRGTTDQPPPRSLADVFLWYCQPINPYWRYRGDAGTQAKRQHFAAMAPNDPWIKPELIATVLGVLRGYVGVGAARGLVDFAACNCIGCGRDTHGPEDAKVVNCFWKSGGSASWGPNTVRIVPGSRRKANPLLAVTLGAAVVLGSVWLVREVR